MVDGRVGEMALASTSIKGSVDVTDDVIDIVAVPTVAPPPPAAAGKGSTGSAKKRKDYRWVSRAIY